MASELTWIVSTATSSLHVASAMLSGAPLAERRTAEALAEAVERLSADLTTSGLSPQAFAEHAPPLSVRFDTPRGLAEALVAKTLGPYTKRDIPERLSGSIAGLYAAFQAAQPNALTELELRSGPIRQQWEARGPGLLAELTRLTQDELLPPVVDVILVHPVLGGGGVAHPMYNSVRLEAVLANSYGELPEVARLAWLVAQLNLDLPLLTGALSRDEISRAGPLALIPPVLSAGQEVELTRYDLPTLRSAAETWCGSSVDPAVLADWWEVYHSDRPEWAVALAALARMLPVDEPQG